MAAGGFEGGGGERFVGAPPPHGPRPKA